MKFRRALLLLEPGQDPEPALRLLGHVAPGLDHLLTVVPLPGPMFFRTASEKAPGGREEEGPSPEALREATRGAARAVDVELTPEMSSDALAALCTSAEVDLLVVASTTLKNLSLAFPQRKRPPVAILWPGATAALRPVEHLGCIALDGRSMSLIEAFLRSHTGPSTRVTLLSLSGLASGALRDELEVAGVRAKVEVASLLDVASVRRWLENRGGRPPMDLLVLARSPSALLLTALATTPVLLLPPLEITRRFESPIDLPDAVATGGAIRVRVDHLASVGSLAPVPELELGFVSGGHVVATVITSQGEAELPAELRASSLGVYRIGTAAPPDPLTAIEQRIAILRPGARPLVLFDAELPDDMLRALRRFSRSSAHELLAIRLRPTRSARAIRQRLRARRLAPRVLDARAVLDEGSALDVSASFDAVRLGRVALALRRVGFSVAAVVHSGPLQPSVEGLVVLDGHSLEPGELPAVLDRGPAVPVVAAPTPGNRIELELDNSVARRWLLEAIDDSRSTLHLQVYMALDDEVGSAVEAALAAAGARGVTVRVLVDSLHGLHGSFGARNPVLDRLSARPGVELRASRPITELPSLADLKQRDHRKLVVSDGRVALLGGRNLSHEYYTAFDEVKLTLDSPWRQVPWLDAGARVQGPAVAALSAAFLEAWTEAGGAPFEIVRPAPAGASAARVVVHRGLRDARTLETYLELIESARSHVHVVNGFPLLLELQHALVRALGRGVRVRSLLGHLTPTHAGDVFQGTWSSARRAATELVHSRMDPIVAAGGEAYLFARRGVPGWAPELGLVHPHVHAKAMSVDGERCAVGSANFDVTGSYWESELLLVVEDSDIARGFEAQVEALLESSVRIERGDPAWQKLARRRAWMRYWPGVLSI